MAHDKMQYLISRLTSMGAISLAVAYFCTGAPAAGLSELAGTVSRLGLNQSDPGAGFDLLEKSPHQAVELLVQELHPIKRGAYFENKKTEQSRHVLACLRALRYITGRSFSVPTRSKLSDDEKQFLDFDKEMHDNNPGHKIHFFGVWMSRDAEYVAPQDAQLAIIEKWKDFVRSEGKDFLYHPAASAKDSMDSWYWYG